MSWTEQQLGDAWRVALTTLSIALVTYLLVVPSWRAATSGDWVETKCEIDSFGGRYVQSSRDRRRGRGPDYVMSVSYRYEANGVRYFGSDVDFTRTNDPRDNPVTEGKVGGWRTWRCWYDPDDPYRSVLDRNGWRIRDILWVVFAGFVAAMAALLPPPRDDGNLTRDTIVPLGLRVAWVAELAVLAGTAGAAGASPVDVALMATVCAATLIALVITTARALRARSS